ncbi:MAG: TRAP transporter large permease subunit [Deltaproteobacteria bacterium]|nr:TRAP transporter large permease subunit [Deltaproteobacteria bacterium]
MIQLFLSSLFGFVLLGMPIAIALFLTALVLSWSMDSWSPALVVQTVFRGVDNFPLMAIPFFLLAGEIMNTGGIAQRIIMVAKAMFGHVRGGLGYVTVVASMLISGVSGSAVADASAIGSILYPVMKKEGYDPPKAAALFAAATTNGPIIPPSIPMVVFGVIANVSVIRLFIGGIIPGIILGTGLMIGWWLHVRGKQRYHVEGKFSLIFALKACLDAFWALFLMVIILGGILLGICTATEAAVVSAVYAFIVSFFIYRELKVKDFLPVLVNTCRGTAVVLFVCGAAMAAAYFITTAQIPEMLSALLLKLSGGNWVIFMFWVNILLLIVGCVMDLVPALLILGPMLHPIATQQYGLDPVYFGVVIIVNLCIGLITPPVGNILFVACGLSKIPMAQMARAIWPNIVIGIIVIFIVTYLPWTVTYLPSLIPK